ncbi:MAG: DUF2442 domain-containing protein [Methylocystis sp.]|nr:DUF2442 domain-containing protein [Methylocystis sp.]MBI3275074.1 DUF2442 domain-containing protein [Methylocystis sp.]
MVDLSNEQFDAAKARGDARRAGLRAESAHYDAGRNRIVVCLTSGVEIGFPPACAQGLENAKPADLDPIEITPAGLGLHFPKLDADLYVPALLEGALGSANWMGGAMGRKGGKSRSARKTAAARENGKRGGRPRNTAA